MLGCWAAFGRIEQTMQLSSYPYPIPQSIDQVCVVVLGADHSNTNTPYTYLYYL